ncbi:hypothetical protein M3196_00095 [Fictibacillus nanhaiensis]|uniref:phage tail terminator family protein n=1 Tax=Fictibacillus nanhaiensis TaxID=742169 RepID=UPI00203D11F3|nr:hypothetical protein [Fictibacillus nanhaiensis]MCM3730069.1 hypothetical protein [Fictibacillus nanhaiensis]
MMIDIRNEVISILKANFPNHKLYGEKVTQGLIRPCFFIDLIPIDIVKLSPNMQERSMIIDVQYMSLEDTKLKNLEMAETLGQLFTTIEFGEFKAKVSNERFDIVDGILHYLFDLDFIVIGKQEEQIDLIGNINLNEEAI